MSFGSDRLGTPTQDQEARFVAVRSGGCIVCLAFYLQWVIPEIHHLLHGGYTLGHDFTIGLCPWHHRGVPREPFTSKRAMTEAFGPSLAGGSKLFHLRFGTDQELLDRQNRLIGRRLLQIEDVLKSPLPRQEVA